MTFAGVNRDFILIDAHPANSKRRRILPQVSDISSGALDYLEVAASCWQPRIPALGGSLHSSFSPQDLICNPLQNLTTDRELLSVIQTAVTVVLRRLKEISI